MRAIGAQHDTMAGDRLNLLRFGGLRCASFIPAARSSDGAEKR
jgi:hypothetical protein